MEQPTFEEFRASIGKKFRILNNHYTGKLAEQDVIIAVHDETQEVEGDKFIAHFTECRFIQDVPESLKATTPITTSPLKLFD